jgi:hypothetical protein
LNPANAVDGMVNDTFFSDGDEFSPEKVLTDVNYTISVPGQSRTFS